MYGFNNAPKQFGSAPVAKFDPNASNYLHSDALKMIQETENKSGKEYILQNG
jgi:hypothetical protein